MFYYIPQIILFLALAIFVWVVARNLPKLDLAELESELGRFRREKKARFWSKKIFKNKPIEEVDEKVNKSLEKSLRKIKLVLTKLDTRIQKSIDFLKDRSRPKSIFKPEENTETKPAPVDFSYPESEKDEAKKEEPKDNLDSIAAKRQKKEDLPE